MEFSSGKRGGIGSGENLKGVGYMLLISDSKNSSTNIHAEFFCPARFTKMALQECESYLLRSLDIGKF